MQLTKDEFEREWLKYVACGYGHMKAFDIANEWHMEKFGQYRYASYYSFANVRDGRNK